jgi:hypothetical protein
MCANVLEEWIGVNRDQVCATCGTPKKEKKAAFGRLFLRLSLERFYVPDE